MKLAQHWNFLIIPNFLYFNADFWPRACLLSAVLVLVTAYFVLQTNSMINQSFSNFSFCLMSFHFLSLKSQTDMDLNIGCERLFHSCCFLCFLQVNNVVVFVLFCNKKNKHVVFLLFSTRKTRHKTITQCTVIITYDIAAILYSYIPI